MTTTTSVRHQWSYTQGRTAASGAVPAPAVTPATIRFMAQAAMRPSRPSGRDLAVRALNLIVALLAILVTAPLLALIALAVRFSSPGPVIYRQPRVGLDRRRDRANASHRRQADQGGRIFVIYKFRTMYDCDRAQQVWASKEDSRITPVGRILRPFRLDELPQLFNVLKGDMNIVGPRPEQPAIFADLSEELSGFRRRQRVLPGITGLAQITLPYDQDIQGVKDKVSLDLEYIRRRSVTQDLLIMAKTMPVMVLRKGAL